MILMLLIDEQFLHSGGQYSCSFCPDGETKIRSTLFTVKVVIFRVIVK